MGDTHRHRLAGAEHGQADAEVPLGPGVGAMGMLEAQPLPAQAASWCGGRCQRHPWHHPSVTPASPQPSHPYPARGRRCRRPAAGRAEGVRAAEPRGDPPRVLSRRPHLEEADDGFGAGGSRVQDLRRGGDTASAVTPLAPSPPVPPTSPPCHGPGCVRAPSPAGRASGGSFGRRPRNRAKMG